MKIVWQKKALNDLDSIYKFIEQDSPQNALIVFNGICDLATSLQLFPYKFPKEPAFESGNVRYAVIWNFKIVYAIENNTILVLRIFSTKQHPKKLKF